MEHTLPLAAKAVAINITDQCGDFFKEFPNSCLVSGFESVYVYDINRPISTYRPKPDGGFFAPTYVLKWVRYNIIFQDDLDISDKQRKEICDWVSDFEGCDLPAPLSFVNSGRIFDLDVDKENKAFDKMPYQEQLKYVVNFVKESVVF